MNTLDQLKQILSEVALALGSDLLKEMAFVGGCTTGLHITDEFTKENVRFTDDVDLIVSVTGYVGWSKLEQRLMKKGFKLSMEDDINCRMRLGEIIIDFMPDDENVLGYSNQWYADALKSAQPYQLNECSILLITPPYFIATKLEAYKGRGNNDPMESRDIEDILSLIDGREELIEELKISPAELRTYISHEIVSLLDHSYFQYAVQSTAKNDQDREEVIFDRLDQIKSLID
jgi:predicted nucleotidyltransferase